MSERELATGERFGEFTIEGILGRGGMGVVYRARQDHLDRLVALKVIAPHLAHDQGFRERFRREAAMAAAIDHPSIIPIYEADAVGDQPYIAMRYVPGTDLKTVIERRGRLPVGRALDIVEGIAGALDAAHRRGLVHRDVKPANILIAAEDDEDGDSLAYLTDFGLTKGRSDERLTQTGKWVGTVDYMAPEQIEGKDVDGRADQYALACVLLEALTGSVPFRRDTDVQVMWAHIRDEPPVPSVVRPELGPAFDAIIARGLAKDAAARYPTCRDFVRASREALAGALGASARGGTETGTLVDGTPPPPVPIPKGDGGGSRRNLLIAAGALAALVLGGIAAYAIAGGGGDGPRTVAITTQVTVPASVLEGGAAATTGPASTAESTPEDATTEAPATSEPEATTDAPPTSEAPPATTDPEPPSTTDAPPTTEEPPTTAEDPGGFPPTTAAGVIELASRPVPFLTNYTLIQGGEAGTLLLAYDGDERLSYRVDLPDQGTVWAGFDAAQIVFGCLQEAGAAEPTCTDGTDREEEYRGLIQEFVNGLLTPEAVQTNFGALADAGAPVLTGEQTGQTVACVQNVGEGTARLCVREDSIITEVTVIENSQEIGVRATEASPDVTEADFQPPVPIS